MGAAWAAVSIHVFPPTTQLCCHCQHCPAGSLQATNLGKVLEFIDRCGAVNLKAMQLLDEGHTSK